MLLNILVACLLMLLTTIIHGTSMILAFRLGHETWVTSQRQFVRVSGTVLFMFFVSLLEVFIWAAAYMALGAIKNIEQAIYFSMVTYTTLGYGDVLLDEHWRLLASFEAANGIMMFGWTTAIIMAVVRRVYFKDKM